jgi:pyruvate kinase
MSRIRSGIPIFGLSRFDRSCRLMALMRGVYPVHFDVTQVERVKINESAIACLLDLGYVDKGDLVIVTKGAHMGSDGGGTCTMRIVCVGESC